MSREYITLKELIHGNPSDQLVITKDGVLGREVTKTDKIVTKVCRVTK